MVSPSPFENLATRPPTPPKDHNNDIDEALEFLNAEYTTVDANQNQNQNQTQEKEKEKEQKQEQEQIPSSSAAQPSPPSSLDNGSKERTVKRVEFSPCVTAHNPIPFGTTISKGSPLSRGLLFNKDVKPLRSILKSTLSQDMSTPDSTTSSALDYFSISDPATFPVMLESVVKSLAAQSSSSRLDGYRTLNGALKAYENLADFTELKAKMPLLAQSMARDISAVPSKNDPTEALLVTQALKLVTAILLIPALDGSLTQDFQALLLDKSIDVISREGVSKTTVNHHMFLLASQKFSSKVMTAPRAEQLVASLITIQDRVSGNSVVAARLVILQRLMDQSHQVMLATIRDWLPHIFHGSLSSMKDVRLRAAEAGMHAGLVFGNYAQATKALIDLFNAASKDTGTYGAYMTARLSDMVSNKELAPHVPQVWSMVVLFFRSNKIKLQRWPFFKNPWLVIIQHCMNSSDSQVKYRASLAWNRLIFVINPDLEAKETMDGTVNMLKIPFVTAFDKKDRERHGSTTRQLAISGYCHLLHYALRPSQNWKELDIYWDDYVHAILSKMLRSGPKDVTFASRALKALLNGKPKVWDVDLANNPTILSPEDLPRLDCGWVRSRIQKVLDLIGPHIGNVLSLPAEEGSLDKTPWQDLLTAIAEAGSQEVRATVHLKETLAHLMNFLGHLWKNASRNFMEQSDGLWITRFGDLVQSAVDKIGPLHFSEATLVRNEAEDFEAAPTPSHRPSKHHVALQSPMVFLFSLFQHPPTTVKDNADFFQVATNLLHGICQGKLSRKSKLQLLRQCSDAIKREPGSGPPSVVGAKLWSILAQEFALSLTNHDLDQGTQEERLGTKTRDTVHMLNVGFEYCALDTSAISAWQHLYGTAATLLKQEAGEGAVVLGMMEPIAESLVKLPQTLSTSTCVQLTSTLLQNGSWPKNRQQMDEGRKALSNSSITHIRHAIFEPFVHVLSLVDTTLHRAYGSLQECTLFLPSLVEAVEQFLQQSPGSQLHAILRKMQEGLASFIGDTERLITHSGDGLHQLLVKVFSLWQTVLRLLKSLPTNAMLLKALDVLFAAALNSSHGTIINATVIFWNETFGQLDSLAYPPKLELALRRVRALVELDLPTFPENDDDSVVPLETLNHSQMAEPNDTTPSKKPVSIRTRSSRLKGTTPVRLSAIRDTPSRRAQSAERNGSSTPRQRRSASKAKAKLRHDDSQVQFVAVQSSSPGGTEMESQLLTDHQKEVISRQHFETAQMYPDFSSSPAPKSTKSKAPVPRLDFSDQNVISDGHATPTLEEHGPMDDYLGSSPTPKATEKAGKAPSGLRETTLASQSEDAPPSDNVEDSDVPSSPPQMPEDTDHGNKLAAPSDQDDQEYSMMDLDETVIEELDTGGVHGEHREEAAVEQDKLDADESVQAAPAKDSTHIAQEAEDAMNVEPTDHPATEPPTAPQDVDEEAAVFGSAPKQKVLVPSSNIQESDLFVDAPAEFEGITKPAEETFHDSSPIGFTDSLVDVHSAEGASQDTHAEEKVEDDTRVGDSFLGTTPEPAESQNMAMEEQDQPEEDSQASQRSMQTRQSKRRRGSGTPRVTPSKRRKQSSPLKRAFSWVTGSQEEASDEDIGECILVASQPEESAESTETPAVPASAPASVDVPKAKRGRGRPRKSETPVNSTPSQPASTRRVGRPSSAISPSLDKAVVTDTPGRRTSRRITRSQNADLDEMPAEIEVPRTVGRKAEAVVIPAAAAVGEKRKREEMEAEDEAEDGDTDNGPDSQLRLEQEEASQRERVIARPKSIMEKLKSILAECKTMVLGSQEYRELDDALFEVRREVHEAAARGRGE